MISSVANAEIYTNSGRTVSGENSQVNAVKAKFQKELFRAGISHYPE